MQKRKCDKEHTNKADECIIHTTFSACNILHQQARRILKAIYASRSETSIF